MARAASAPKRPKRPPSDRTATGSRLRVGGRPLELLDEATRKEFLGYVGYVSVDDAAVAVGWHPRTVYKWLRLGAEADQRLRAHVAATTAYTDALLAFDDENVTRAAAGRKPLPEKQRPPRPPPFDESADDLLYRQFRQATRVAKRRGKVGLVLNIAALGKKRWQANAWLLKHRFPEEFADRRRGDPVDEDPASFGTLRVRRETPEETAARHATPVDDETDDGRDA